MREAQGAPGRPPAAAVLAVEFHQPPPRVLAIVWTAGSMTHIEAPM